MLLIKLSRWPNVGLYLVKKSKALSSQCHYLHTYWGPTSWVIELLRWRRRWRLDVAVRTLPLEDAALDELTLYLLVLSLREASPALSGIIGIQ